MDRNLKRAIIIDNYKEPVGKGLIDDHSYKRANMSSESCIDEIEMMVKLENGLIKDIRFTGEACAISTSATSIMIKLLMNKTVEEAKEIIKNYENMINNEEYNKELLGEANVYDEIYKQPNRIKCALFPWDCFKKIIVEK
ncbi:MAG: SUF system NifU family Fe-S cluster assembly protein [Bacilli bacterium]|nr:SUF system NifU family Fe-S cluster assembly protein [Bacilli bacterium]